MSEPLVVMGRDYALGPWLRQDETVPDAPHGDWSWGEIGVIWLDDRHTTPLALLDRDGCRAVILRRVDTE